MEHQKPLFLLVGPSGSGKSTIEKELCKRMGLRSIESYTDRPRRTPDETGHIFVSTNEFNALGTIVTHTVFAGYQYGTTKACLDEADIFVVDPNGVREVADLYVDEDREIIIIGIDAPYSSRRQRMEKRGDSYDCVIHRLLHDHSKFEDMCLYCDIVVYNIELEKAVDTIERYMCSFFDGRQELKSQNQPEESYWESWDTTAYIGVDDDGNLKTSPRRYYRCHKCRYGSVVKTRYCPDCGRKMRSKQVNEGEKQ